MKLIRLSKSIKFIFAQIFHLNIIFFATSELPILKHCLIKRSKFINTLVYSSKHNLHEYFLRNEDHLPCSICGKILKSKGNLSTHEKTHRILSPDEYWYCVSNLFSFLNEIHVVIDSGHLWQQVQRKR